MMTKLSHIIGIHGVPRSGTSWLAQIVNSHPGVLFKFQPLFSYGLKNRINEMSSKEEIHRFYEDMVTSQDTFLNMKDPRIHKNYPSFFKNVYPDFLIFKQVHHHFVLENMLTKDEALKMIFVVRNPLAVLTSWAKAPREFYPAWDFNEEWRTAAKKNEGKKENYFGFNKWKEATHMFMQLKEQFGDRILLVNYSELVENTRQTVDKLFSFIGVKTLDKQTIEFLENSQNRNDSDPNSVYKSKQDDLAWKSFINKEILNEVMNDGDFQKINNIFKWL